MRYNTYILELVLLLKRNILIICKYKYNYLKNMINKDSSLLIPSNYNYFQKEYNSHRARSPQSPSIRRRACAALPRVSSEIQ